MPVVSTVWLLAPLGVVQGIYAKYFGLPLTTIAAVVLFARLFDAVSDPLVGYYCDRYYRRTGTRKPFIFVGGLFFILSSYFLYVPYGVDASSVSGDGASAVPTTVSTAYFASCFIMFYLAWTLFEIPHLTWASELAPNTSDKAKIYSYRNVAHYLGLIIFYAVPLSPLFKSSDITPDTLEISVIAADAALLVLLAVCLKTVPDHALSRKNTPYSNAISESMDSPTANNRTVFEKFSELRLLLHDVVDNKLFLMFIAAYSLTSMATGMWYGLLFLYVDVYLGLGDQFAPMFVIGCTVGIVSTPAWCYLTVRLGKKATWMMSLVLLVFGYIYTGSLSPGKTDLSNLVILQTTIAVGFACIGVIAPAMLAEISDYGAWKSGTERPASYFSLYIFTGKLINALASALGFAIAGWYGFDATVNAQTQNGIFGATLVTAWLPAFFAVLALGLLLFIPATTRRHAIIERRLNN